MMFGFMDHNEWDSKSTDTRQIFRAKYRLWENRLIIEVLNI